MKKILIIVLFVMIARITSAQNNPIFQGGLGDGVNKVSFAQAANNIFTGGNADGWNKAGFAQPVSNIFQGGTGDGWHRNSFAQVGNGIFNGGAGDGWSGTSYLQAGNAIFNGGNGDGWNFVSFLQSGNNIFKGGIGDGWSSTYRPMGPLPVTFIYFDANKQVATSILRWKTSQEVNSDHFEIERSNDALNYFKIGTVRAAGNSSSPTVYDFIDDKPLTGMNYYRLKQVDLDGRYVYTPSRMVRFDKTDTFEVQYYPNPTTDIIIIKLAEGMAAEPLVVNISNASGIVLMQLKLPAHGNSIIPIKLGQYAKGIYFIQVKTSSINSTARILLQ